MNSPIYWHPKIYEIVTKILYNKNYVKRYKEIGKEAKDLEVLDLCCGDCKLSNFIRNYRGIDFNKNFVEAINKKNINIELRDISSQNIPKSECIIMQGSLYQFIPNHEKIIKRILNESIKKAIISEPYINMASSKNRILAFIGKLFTKTSKMHEKRFTKKELIVLFKKYEANKIIDLGRDIMAVFEKK